MAVEEVGGISGKVQMDSSGIDPQLAKLRSALTTVEERLHILHGSFGQTGVAAALTGERIARLAAAKIDLKAQIDALVVSTRRFDTAQAGVANGSRFNAQSMLFLGQAIDDVQYGFGAIVNQVPQLLMSFGVGAGVAGAMSIVAVGANQLTRNWSRLTEMFVSRGPETAAQEMERLGNATGRTADETARLTKLKKEAAQVEQQLAMRPAAEKAGGEAAGKVLAEGPFDETRRRVLEAMKKEVRTLPVTDAEVESRVANILRNAPPGAVDADAAEANIRKRLGKERLADRDRIAEEETTRLLREAQFGEGGQGEAARRRLAQMDPSLAFDFERISPEAQRANRDAEAEARAELRRRVEQKERELEGMGLADPDAVDIAGGTLLGQDAAAGAGDRAHEAALERVRKLQEGNEIKEGMNEKRNDKFFDAQRLTKRIRQMMVSQSQVFDMADLNRSVQSTISNSDPSLKQRDRMILELRQLNTNLLNLSRPVRPGN